MKSFFLVSFVFLGLLSNNFSQYQILEHKENVEIVELKNLNTKSRECNLSVTPNGSQLYFMSTRANKASIGDGDLYYTEIDFEGNCSEPKILGKAINSEDGEDEPSITSDGQHMFYQSWKSGWETNGGPYYVSQKTASGWSKGIGMGGGINRFFRMNFAAHFGFATDGMCVSSDGNLFIVACGPDYYGNMDLFFSEKKDGIWQFPQKLRVSTEGDERSIFIAADSKTLYFSSNGYGGFGGMDLFKTTLVNGKVGEVVNLGAPFNTSKDDMGFVVTRDGNSAFLVRDLDIYYADLTHLSESIKPIQCLDSISAELELSIDETPKILDPIDKIIKLEPLKTDTKPKTMIVFFEFDKFHLTHESIDSLELFIKQIGEKAYSVNITAHTDSFGDESYNENLALLRLATVKSWLEKKQIKVSSAVGFGERNPKVSNDTPLNRKKNRRVEIEISFD